MPEDFRAMRGIVIHVLPKLKEPFTRYHSKRDPLGSTLPRKPRGTCVWCLRSAISQYGFKVNWHKECLDLYSAFRGLCVRPDGISLIPESPCEICKVKWSPDFEIDHRVSIGVAFLQGNRQYIRAFLPLNFRYLCRSCHRIKTHEDTLTRISLKEKTDKRQMTFLEDIS